MRVGVISFGPAAWETAGALANAPEPMELIAVCDTSARSEEWRRIPTVTYVTSDFWELLADPDIDVVYADVPPDRQLGIYVAVMATGKDLLGEPPFGIDLKAATKIAGSAEASGQFVRCRSEFACHRGAQNLARIATDGALGKLAEVSVALVSSMGLADDQLCGEHCIHLTHLPFRLGLVPFTVSMDSSDSSAGATIHGSLEGGGAMRLEMKKAVRPGLREWRVELGGTDGGVRFSTREPDTLWTYHGERLDWRSSNLGSPAHSATDPLVAMWSSFALARKGEPVPFDCATPAEAALSHRLLAAAKRSAESHQPEPLDESLPQTR
jgi:predicted dehydrogenase